MLFSVLCILDYAASRCHVMPASVPLHLTVWHDVCIIDEQVEVMRTEMHATVTRLETELSELQQSRTALQHDSAQQLESLERLRRENAELQQRVRIMSISQRDRCFSRDREDATDV